MIVTFYSFKGGVGRSMALVNVGEILADLGYRVVLCDWDLEAPGLERYLVPDGGGAAQSRELARLLAQEGLIDLLLDYKETLTRPLPEEPPSAIPDTHAPMGKLLLRRPSSQAVPVSTERRREGSLSLLTAGRRDGEAYQRYAEAVRTFDWEEFYVKWAGDAYIDFFRRELLGKIEAGTPGAADIVLIDSRTGVTEQGGVCTHHLADLVVLLSAANNLNLEGTLWMARSLSEERLLSLREGRPVQILPVASRIEQTAEKEELGDFRRRFRQELRRYAAPAVGSFDEHVLAAEIPYMPFYSFNERVVAREPEEEREPKLYGAYAALAEGIVRCGVSARLLPETGSLGRIARTAFHSVRPGAVRGMVFLDYSRDVRETAVRLAEGMAEGGVRVCSDFLLAAGDDSSPRQLAESLASCAGYVLLLGRGGLSPSLRAQLDYALRRQALRPGFRIVPVLMPGVDRKILGPVLSRIYCLTLPEDLPPPDSDFFENLAAELASGSDALAAADESVQPFRGLEAFEEAHASAFFGRDAEVLEVLRLQERAAGGAARWIQVEGASGVGKTSLARAGLVPAARRGWFPGGFEDWTVVVCSPGADPALHLASALARASGTPVSALQEDLLRQGSGLVERIREAAPPGGAVLLVIDQLEEAVLLADAPGAVARFDEALALAVEAPGLPFFLITTVRSELVDRFPERLPRLQAALDRMGLRYRLGALSEEALAEIAAASARFAGLAFESGLAERVVRDLRGTGQTPALLGIVLRRLWESRDGDLLTHEAYDRMGGVEGVVALSADRLLDRLQPDDLVAARSLLLRLVSAAGTRLAVARDDLLAGVEDEARAERILRLLADARVVTSSEDQVELAHDALVAFWPRLRGWIEAARGTLARREELETAAAAWESAGEPREGLPSTRQLAYFSQAPPGSRRSRRFLVMARQDRARQERQRLWRTAAVLLISLVLGVSLSVRQYWKNEAEARSRSLAVRAVEASGSDPVRSLVLAVEAAEAAETDEARRALQAAVRESRELAVLSHDASVDQAHFSPDGKLVLTTTFRAVGVWTADTGRRLARFQPIRDSASRDPRSYSVFSPDGEQVLSLSADGLVVWEVRTGRVRQPPSTRLGLVLPNLTLPQTAAVFEALAGETLKNLAPRIEAAAGERSACVAISPDGRQLLVGDEDGALRVWTIPSLRQIGIPLRSDAGILSCAFSPDGRKVAAAGSGGRSSLDGTVQLWDLGEGRLLSLIRAESPILALDFSPDGRRLAMACADSTVRIRDLVTGEELAVLKGHTDRIDAVSFSPDGRRLVTASTDKTARIWNMDDDDQGIETASFSELREQARARIPITLTPWDRERLLAVGSKARK